MFYILFNRSSLNDRLKLLSLFHSYGTLWMKDGLCEIVVTSDTLLRFRIPYIKTNITHEFNVNLTYDIRKISLENTKSNEVLFKFNNNMLYVEEIQNNNITFTPDYNLHKIESVSAHNTISLNEHAIDPVEFIYDVDCSDDNKNIKPIQIYDKTYSITSVLVDEYKLKELTVYRLSLERYSDVRFIIIQPLSIFRSYIDKLLITKTMDIEIKLYSTNITFKAIRNNSADRSGLTIPVINNTVTNNKEYKIEMKNFSLIKKLDISIGDVEFTKDKKIFNKIEMHGIYNGHVLIGLCIYPCNIPLDIRQQVASDYFIFIRVLEM